MLSTGLSSGRFGRCHWARIHPRTHTHTHRWFACTLSSHPCCRTNRGCSFVRWDRHNIAVQEGHHQIHLLQDCAVCDLKNKQETTLLIPHPDMQGTQHDIGTNQSMEIFCSPWSLNKIFQEGIICIYTYTIYLCIYKWATRSSSTER